MPLGSRHAMGGQQFCADALMLDIRKLNRALAFDRERGLIEVESGMQWPQLLEYLQLSQRGAEKAWAFAQKQTGADRLTMGGCLSANIHGRGLTMPPSSTTSNRSISSTPRQPAQLRPHENADCSSS